MKKLNKWAVLTALFVVMAVSALGCAQSRLPSSVTLDLNYEGSTAIVESVASGQSFYEPTAPTREGYDFSGWYLDAACTEGQKVVFPLQPTRDMTLYASWTAYFQYNFDVNYEGGAIESIKTYEPIAADFRPAYRDGYNFGGWYLDAACTEGQEADLSVAGTYYAKWTANAHDAFSYEFSSDNTGFAITETVGTLPTDLVLPESHLGFPVVEIAAGKTTAPTVSALYYESLVIPGTIRTIGNYAFVGATYGSITFEEGLESIGNYAFAGASAYGRLNKDADGKYMVSEPVAPVTFPSSLRSIGTYAFIWTPLSAVTFSEGLESIGTYAFAGYSATNANLAPVTDAIFQPFTEVHFPSTMKEIGAYAFMFNKLEKVTFADGCVLDTLGNYTFAGNVWTSGQKKDFRSPIKYAELPGFSDPENTTISYTFQYCSSLEEVVFKGPISRIGTAVFKNCSSLGTVEGKPFELPEGVTYLYGAFENTMFTSITIPGTLEESATALSNAFKGNSALQTVVFEEGSLVTALNATFQNCTSLKEIVLPESITAINSNSFNGCTALERVVLPNVQTIAGNAFLNCTALRSVEIGSGEMADITSTTAFKGCNPDQLVVMVPDGLYAAYTRNPDWNTGEYFTLSWTNEDLSQAVNFHYNGMGTDVTERYSRGENVVLPELGLWLDSASQTEYVMAGWYTDEQFTTLFDPAEAVSSDLNLYAKWEACSDPLDAYYEFRLTEDQQAYIITRGKATLTGAVTLPESYRGLPVVGIRDGEGTNTNNILKDAAFAEATGITSLVVPSSYKYIGIAAFVGCGKIESITFNEGLESIGNYAFLGNTNTSTNTEASKLAITSLSFPQSLRIIGDHAFNGCDNLQSITFHPNAKLESIGQYAFAGNYVNVGGVYTQYGADITTLTIPASVKTIGNYAFSNAFDLETLTFAEGSALESIGNYAFSLTLDYQGTNYTFVESKLTSVVFPASLRSIGSYAFAGRNGLKEVVLNEGLTSIMAYAFAMYGQTGYSQSYAKFEADTADWAMSSPTEVNLPSSVVTLGNYAFAYWVNLEKVTFNGNSFVDEDGDPSFGNYVFAWARTLTTVNGLENCVLPEFGDYVFGHTAVTKLVLPAGTEFSSNTFTDAEQLQLIDLSAGTFAWSTNLLRSQPNAIVIIDRADLDFYLADDNWFELISAGRVFLSVGEVEQPETEGYTLYFDRNYEGGGYSYATLEPDEGTWVPTAPTREGYVFAGWYVDAACTELFVFGDVLTADTTVYACWVEA